MSLSQRLVVGFLRGLTSLISRIDDADLARVPTHGPLIIYTNHVNLLEIPVVYTHLQPRRMHGMALADRWQNPLLGWLLDVAESIPLHRGEADIAAIRQGLKVLERGEILLIAPEGTRSHDGRLGVTHPGVVLLALHSLAPLMPLAFYGAEKYAQNLLKLTRSDFHLRVGQPFHLEARGVKVTRLVRGQMLDELMGQLAGLLPPQYRGRYAEAVHTNPRYIVFE